MLFRSEVQNGKNFAPTDVIALKNTKNSPFVRPTYCPSCSGHRKATRIAISVLGFHFSFLLSHLFPVAYVFTSQTPNPKDHPSINSFIRHPPPPRVPPPCLLTMASSSFLILEPKPLHLHPLASILTLNP